MQQADAVLIKDLASSMCLAHGPSLALLEAAKACSNYLPGVVWVGLAILARDKQSLRYATLLDRQPAEQQLVSLAPAGAAAGIAIHTKQAVNVRDINTGDLGMEDLQYFRHVYDAASFFAAPLVVSRSALGALCLASAQSNAFTGHEVLLQTVAAMCAPYITLLSTNLAALEGLVKQILPVRVALQLRDAAHQLQQQQGLAAAEGAHALGSQTESSSGPPTDSGGLNSTDHQSAEALQQGAPAASSSSPWSQASRWQRQRQLPPRLQQRQQQHAVDHTPQQLLLQQRQSAAEQQAVRMGEQQAPPLSIMGPLLTFRQPELELAYRMSMCRQWQKWLDGLLLLLSLLSAVGGWLAKGVSGDMLVGTLLLLVVAVVGWVVAQQLFSLPCDRYLQVRGPGIAAVRLLRVLVFCLEAQQLPDHLFTRPGAAAAAAVAAADAGGAASGGGLLQLLGWSQVEVAGCGILMMLGLSGQLQLAWHAVVQLVSVAGLFGMLHWRALQRGGAGGALTPHVIGSQLLLGWLLPVALVLLVEWHTRRAFFKKIR